MPHLKRGLGRNTKMTGRSDQAILLTTHELGEADLIVTLLTPEHGKVRAVARSARKSRKRFRGVLEAMSHGIPVVATNVGGVSEAVLNERTGLLSERKNVAQFSANIAMLGNRPELRQQFGETALSHYAENFTADRMVNELQGIYEDMTEGA